MTMRSILRRAVRPLPARAQVALREVREAAAGKADSAVAVRKLRAREQEFIDEVTRQHLMRPDRRRILVCAVQQPMPWLETTCRLATALRLRGHHVRGVLCDGLLPLCEMNLGVQDRPPCDVCVGWLARYEDAYGFAFERLSSIAAEGERAAIDASIDEAMKRSPSTCHIDGIDLGPLARRELQRYHRGFVFEPHRDPAYRSWLISGALLVRMFKRLLGRDRPDIVVASSGRTLVAAILTAVARAMGIRVVSWDTEPSFHDGLVFSHRRPAVEIPLDDAWVRAAHEPLTAGDRARLQSFLGKWAHSDGTPFPYNPDATEDRDVIRTQLGLRDAAPLIVAFANSAWDMAVVDRDVGFANMFEWLFTLVEYAAAHSEVDLVVRAHPAEVKVPRDLQSRTPVVREIRRRYGPLPANIKLVDGHSPISSYVLADLAQVAMVYASRIGLELAIRGKRPWLAGDVTYRGKGFTRDISSGQEMTALLDEGRYDEHLSDDERELAQRFAHLWFFRYLTRTTLLRPSAAPPPFGMFQRLAPGGDLTVDAVCRAIISCEPFLDLASELVTIP